MQTTRQQFKAKLRLRDAMRERLLSATGRVADDEGLLEGVAEFFVGGRDESEAEQARRDAAGKALEFAQGDMTEVEQRLTAALSALEESTGKYVQALKAQATRRTAVDQLRVHVKKNILHYMQAVWAHEPPDQRFFRLYDLDVLWAGQPVGLVHVEGLAWGGNRIYGVSGRHEVDVVLPWPEVPAQTRKLVEVADLDTLIGFKGNYLIFPLKESCYLTDFMMQEYVDDYFGVRDPDPVGNFTTEELLEYIECAYHHPEATEEDRAELRELLIDRLTSPRRDAEEIIVPTGKLFIEALPGVHPLLEDFKLWHRAVDVQKARAEVREAELENLRRAARLLVGERGDPRIDKRVVVQGAEGVVVDPD